MQSQSAKNSPVDPCAQLLAEQTAATYQIAAAAWYIAATLSNAANPKKR